MKQEISSDAWHLKQRILWWLEQNWLAADWRAVKQWRKRLAACVSARGGHLEHML